jgi:hypothetical protein
MRVAGRLTLTSVSSLHSHNTSIDSCFNFARFIPPEVKVFPPNRINNLETHIGERTRTVLFYLGRERAGMSLKALTERFTVDDLRSVRGQSVWPDFDRRVQRWTGFFIESKRDYLK